MKHSAQKALIVALISGLLSLAPDLHAGPALERARPLFTLTTRYFDISFPEECRASALYLAEFADLLYVELAAKLGKEPDKRFPVSFSPDHEEAGGAFTLMPFGHISLNQASLALDDDHGFASDDLRLIFTHELTHAISANVRSPFWTFLSRIVGDPISSSAFFAANPGLLEGAAVSFESANGEGRINNPYAMASIRQDILENRALTFAQSGGAWDRYPFGTARYNYGGAFSWYLQKVYGEERYAELWRTLGRGNALGGLDGWAFGQSVFETTYGKPVELLWTEFLGFCSVKKPVIASADNLPGVRSASKLVNAIAAHGAEIYWIDAATASLYRMGISDETGERLCAVDGHSETMVDVSPDGRELLVSTSDLSSGFAKHRVRRYDIEGRRWLPRTIDGVREARYAGKGIVAIEPRGYVSDVVYFGETGKRRIVLEGDEKRGFGSPCSPDGKTFYAIMLDESGFSLVRREVDSGIVERLDAASALPHPRYLSEDGKGGLVFSVCDPDGLPRLARLTEDGRLFVAEGMLSGGVQRPVVAGDEVFYVRRMSGGTKLDRYPYKAADLAPIQRQATWERIGAGSGATPDAFLRTSSSPMAKDIRPYDHLEILMTRMWYPVLGFSSIPGQAFQSAGIGIAGTDAFESLDWTLGLSWNWLLDVSEEKLEIRAGSFGLVLSDGYAVDGADPGLAWARKSSAVLSFNISHAIFPDWRRLLGALECAGTIVARGKNAADSIDSFDAWWWPISDIEARGGLMIGFTSLRTDPMRRMRKTGIEAHVFIDAEARVSPEPSPLDFTISGSAMGRLGPLSLSLFGDTSLDGRTSFGPTFRRKSGEGRISTTPLRRPAFREYASSPIAASSLAFGEGSLALLEAEIQEHVLGGPIYLNWTGIDCGYRGALVGDDYLHSLFGRVFVGFTLTRGYLNGFHPSLYLELDKPLTGEGLLSLDFGLSAAY